MKKCPYCAEEIQDEAIVCRYCGRDLKPPAIETKPEVAEPVQAVPIKPSVWKQGAKAATVISVLYVIGQLLTPQNISNLVGNLTIGLIATFLGWWLICAGIVWIWRKLGGVATIALFVVLGTLIFAAVSVLNGNAGIPFSPTLQPTPRPAPTFTPRPAVIPTRTPLLTMPIADDCVWWSDIRRSHLRETVCVQGIAERISGNSENSGNLRIYFDGPPITFYFVDEAYYYAELAVGDCVSSTGIISINEQGILFMRLNGNLEKC